MSESGGSIPHAGFLQTSLNAIEACFDGGFKFYVANVYLLDLFTLRITHLFDV